MATFVDWGVAGCVPNATNGLHRAQSVVSPTTHRKHVRLNKEFLGLNSQQTHHTGVCLHPTPLYDMIRAHTMVGHHPHK